MLLPNDNYRTSVERSPILVISGDKSPGLISLSSPSLNSLHLLSPSPLYLSTKTSMNEKADIHLFIPSSTHIQKSKKSSKAKKFIMH